MHNILSSNFGQIEQSTEFAALGRLKEPSLTYNGENGVSTFLSFINLELFKTL